MTLFKDSAGICKEDKNTYIVMALINLITSIILCQNIGMSGVILGTAISYIYLIIYSYPKYIFKQLFSEDLKLYYKENFIYFIFILLSSVVSFIIGKNFIINSIILSILIKGILSIIVCCIIFTVIFHKTSEYKYYFQNMIKILRKSVKLKSKN